MFSELYCICITEISTMGIIKHNEKEYAYSDTRRHTKTNTTRITSPAIPKIKQTYKTNDYKIKISIPLQVDTPEIKATMNKNIQKIYKPEAIIGTWVTM